MAAMLTPVLLAELTYSATSFGPRPILRHSKPTQVNCVCRPSTPNGTWQMLCDQCWLSKRIQLSQKVTFFQTRAFVSSIQPPIIPKRHPLHLVHVNLGLASRDVLLLARFAAQNINTSKNYPCFQKWISRISHSMGEINHVHFSITM